MCALVAKVFKYELCTQAQGSPFLTPPPHFLVFWLTFLRINEFKKRFWQRFEREMHEMNIIQTSCMHSIHYSKRSQKRF